MVDGTLLEKILKKQKTKVLGLRLPVSAILLYELLDKDEVSELKQVIMSYIVSKAAAKGVEIPEEIKTSVKAEFSKTTDGGNIIFNINVTEQETNNANTKIDVSTLLEKINELEVFLLQIQKYNFDARENAYKIPPARLKDFEEKIKGLKDLVN
ncbi:hypothetical protein [Acidianus manzaensis]|uniref:Uncharacterized protein n=1 Tax=Acidianus manzaensis TaxID=282676 RepID=A0A1W6K1L0_9CREN|nr:hypothetical protein [Acidianus manzaensis]ARM76418.1 hypothetical protein B6F84_10580 [Acidianus manzaensis]